MPENRIFSDQRQELTSSLTEVFSHIDSNIVKVVMVVGCITGWWESRSVLGPVHRRAQEYLLNRQHSQQCSPNHGLALVEVQVTSDFNSNPSHYAGEAANELNRKTNFE